MISLLSSQIHGLVYFKSIIIIIIIFYCYN